MANLKNLSRRIRIEARTRGYAYEDEDVAQAILCRILEGRHNRSTVEQMVIDYVRADIGDKKTSIHRYNFSRPEPYDARDDKRVTGFANQIEAKIELEQLFKCLTKYELLLVELYYAEKYELAEIGEWIGLGADGIGYQVKAVTNKLIKRASER